MTLDYNISSQPWFNLHNISILIQGYYKRNRQFKHFIKPKIFKILTLTMHGFEEKLWKFVTATYRRSMYALLVTQHISTR
jgi:hypothetical protein